MNAYTFSASGEFVAQITCHENPLEPGAYLLPASATFVAIPDTIPDGQQPRWNGNAWALIQAR